jgi:dolichyl-phosphate beta-glucosyltransferase
MKLSVVVPAYNESHRILPSLHRIFTYLDTTHPDHEVIVVDDGSTDGTIALVRQQCGRRAKLRLVSYGHNRGKGYAVRTGALAAQGDIVLFSDADLSTPIEEVEKMLPFIERGYDLVIGSRAHAEAEIRQHQPFYREGAGKLFNALVRLVVRLPFHDTQCGFKLLRREPLLPILRRLEVDRFAFDVELIALAQAMGLKVAEVPVVWVNSPQSRVGLWYGAQAFTDLLRIRRAARRVAAGPALSANGAEAQPPAPGRT